MRKYVQRSAMWAVAAAVFAVFAVVAAGCGLIIPASDGDSDVCGGLAGTACGTGEFCLYETGVCGAGDQTGECTALPEACTFEYAPVCGCDGQTYPNECSAWTEGVSVAYAGECETEPGEMCGGIAGVACAEGQFCLYETGVCGEGDQSGECAITPEACTEEFAPVCGCDGQTYDNECFAWSAGVSVDYTGECVAATQ